MKAIKTWKVLNDECMIRIHRKEDGTIYIKEYQNGELVCTECLEREYEAFLTTRIQEAVDNSYTRNSNVPAELIKLGFVEDSEVSSIYKEVDIEDGIHGTLIYQGYLESKT